MLATLDGRLKRWNRSFYQIHGLDDVRSRLPEDDHIDGRLAVEETGLPNGLLCIDYVRDVLEPDHSAVVIADNQGLVVGGFRDLVVGYDVRSNMAVEELPFRQIGVLAGHHLLHRRKADAVARELVGVELDANRWQRCSHHQHLTDTRDLRDALLHHRGCLVVELGNVIDVRL